MILIILRGHISTENNEVSSHTHTEQE